MGIAAAGLPTPISKTCVVRNPSLITINYPKKIAQFNSKTLILKIQMIMGIVTVI